MIPVGLVPSSAGGDTPSQWAQRAMPLSAYFARGLVIRRAGDDGSNIICAFPQVSSSMMRHSGRSTVITSEASARNCAGCRTLLAAGQAVPDADALASETLGRQIVGPHGSTAGSHSDLGFGTGNQTRDAAWRPRA